MCIADREENMGGMSLSLPQSAQAKEAEVAVVLIEARKSYFI